MSPLRVLVFQHASYCPLGTFSGFLADEGIAPHIVKLNEGERIPDIAAYDALIVLGGPMEVWQTETHPWLIPEKAAIRRWVSELDRPMMGICLGHQLLADALGGKVAPATTAEAGVSDIALSDAGSQHPLFDGFKRSKRAINFHGSEVTSLPRNAARLASTAACANAAFQAGSAAFGIQYHAEADTALMDEWTELEAGKAVVCRLHGEDGVTKVRNDVAAAMPELENSAKRLLSNFTRIARGRRN